MLVNFAWIFIFGFIGSWLAKKLKLPGLVGMIVAGLLIGPHIFHIVDEDFLIHSADLRQFALVVILTRAGLSLNIKELKKVGRPALLMCFVPACFEIIGCMLIGPNLLGLTLLESALLGSVLAAVSPAIIVPRMIRIMNEDSVKHSSVPQMILAGASVDDVVVIVLFTALSGLLLDGNIEVMLFVNIPISIITGCLVGIIFGYLLVKLFKLIDMQDTIKVVLLISLAFLLLEIQEQNNTVAFSGLISIVVVGMSINYFDSTISKRLESKYFQLWIPSEVILFTLVGTSIDLSYIETIGFAAVGVVLFGLLWRMLGVMICLIKTKFTKKERMFSMIAYTPKATVQAAIGAIPLSMGLACGNTILAVSILAILISAPLGAFLIDISYKTLLQN